MTVKTMSTNDDDDHELSHDAAKSDENNSNTMNGLVRKRRPGIIELGDVTPHNIKLLRRLNQVIFPVSYNAKFYKDVLESGPLAKLG
ncbi:hypothetical protein BLA29_012028, partial [Euroglyphus maynei]